MKFCFSDIDNAIDQYTKDEIYFETHQELEELIFFSSYTIKFEVFKKATQKLKKISRKNLLNTSYIWEADATKVIQKYHLDIDFSSERYTYLIQSLLKAQIKINEATMAHFIGLCKRAHSLEYIESRADQIYKLLFDN